MGSFRTGLVLAALPTPALAEVCDKLRPDWDGTPVTNLAEAMHLFSTLPAIGLLVASAIAFRMRHQWGGLIVVVLWAILGSVHAFSDLGGMRAQSIAEGCVGSPILFTTIATAICIGMILYTAPLKQRSD